MRLLRPLARELAPRLVEQIRAARVYKRDIGVVSRRRISLLRHFAAGRTFVDVGANLGSYAYHLKGKAKRTIAFEPIPFLAERVRRHNPGVEVHCIALGDVTGDRELFVPRIADVPIWTRCSLSPAANSGYFAEPMLVPVKRLDDFELLDVGAIKIDVEGHEGEVIRGATSTILASKPLLLVEIEERHHPGFSWSIIDQIRGLGYECYYFDETDELIQGDGFDFDRLQDMGNLPDPITGRGGVYLNDFVFLPRD